MSFVAAVCQMRSTVDSSANLHQAEELIRAAAARGATFVATPENTNYLGPHARKVQLAEALDGAVCSFFSGLAAELAISLLLGSFNEKSSRTDRCFNSSVLFGPSGTPLAVYRKIHLFDVDVQDGVSFRESETVAPGDEVVAVPTPLGVIGMSICYDLRFGELYRALVARGAEIVTVPSAFTATTGRAHWATLLRARAIETQAFVIAPGQWGQHGDGGLKESWGHSTIVDPWGRVLAEVEEGVGIATAEIDLAEVHRVRAAIPLSQHRKLPG